MPWNEPGSGNNDQKDPWTGKPKKDGPPDLEAALRQFKKKLIALLGNKKPSNQSGSSSSGDKDDKPLFTFTRNRIFALAGLIVLVWILWGIFIVGPAEQAVILRFGQYTGTVGPGPHWIARGIEDAYIVNEQRIATYSYDAEMLTKDENIVSVAVAVQYRIDNARDYLFNVVKPNESLQQATASALRQVIGQTNLDQVLTSGREQIRQQVQTQITATLSRYKTGLLVTDVAMQPARAPDEVKEAFDDAIKAQEDEQRFENQAQSYAMQVVPIAVGQAKRLIAEANAYQQQVVLHAQAETAPFLALLPEYKKAPAIMRERIYLETLQKVFTDTNKVLVDTNGNNMFYLPLDKLVPPPIKPAASPIVATAAATTAATSANTTATTSDSDSTTSTSTDDRTQGGY
jgi:membrane protease subunit HflK